VAGEFKKVTRNNVLHGGSKFVGLLSDHLFMEYEEKYHPSDSDIRRKHLEIQ
jgi:hypothetical protein